MSKRFLFLALIAFCFISIGCEDDNDPTSGLNQSPTVTGIQPTTFARGQQQINLKITGTNLSGATLVNLGDGIGVHSITVESATSIAVRFSVQRQASLGKRNVTVATPAGSGVGTGLLTVQGDLPVAKFSFSPKDIYETTTVSFDASSSNDADGNIKSYSWDFGDGTKASGVNVSHKFRNGTFNVSLLVKDNDNLSASDTKPIDVQKRTEVKCTTPVPNNRGLLYGTVIDVEPGNFAIVQMDNPNASCANSFYYCSDMRDAQVDLDFFGIVHEMYELGNGVLKIKNDCPFKWPPQKGDRVFLFYKACSNNFCP